MRSNTLCSASLCFAVIFVQAGCTTDTTATQEPAGSAYTPAVRSDGSANGDESTNRATESRDSSEVANTRIVYGNTVVLPEGTPLTVRTTSTLSTKTLEAGQTFTANLEQPLLLNGREIAPKGAEVQGAIVDADKGGRVKDVATLSVRLTGLEVAGKIVEISTNTITQSAGTTKKEDAVKVGIGAGVGAAIGAIAGGGKGAAIGAAAGGAAGTGVVLATRGEAAVIPSESVLSFELRAPASVTVR